MKNIVIKKRFKCDLCKQRFQLTTSMINDDYIVARSSDKMIPSFICPCCGLEYQWSEGGWDGYYWKPVGMLSKSRR